MEIAVEGLYGVDLMQTFLHTALFRSRHYCLHQQSYALPRFGFCQQNYLSVIDEF